MTAWLMRNLQWVLAAGLLSFIAISLGSALLHADRDLLWP